MVHRSGGDNPGVMVSERQSQQERAPVACPWCGAVCDDVDGPTHPYGAADLDDYTARAREWASAVWSFWSHEHARIRNMLDAARSDHPSDATRARRS